MDGRGLGAGYLQLAERFPRPRVLRLPQASFRTAIAMKADRQTLSTLLQLAPLDGSANALRLPFISGDLPAAAWPVKVANRVKQSGETPHIDYTIGLVPEGCSANWNGR